MHETITELLPLPDDALLIYCNVCLSTLLARPSVEGIQHIEHNEDGSHTWTTVGESTAEFVARVGTDPLKWAQEFRRITGGPDYAAPDMTQWFSWAIEAGRSGGRTVKGT